MAHSLPIDQLAPGAAEYLAGDVEYRLHLVLQEAKKFMVHSKRTTMLPQDVEHALEVLNVEVRPLADLSGMGPVLMRGFSPSWCRPARSGNKASHPQQ